MMRHLGVVRSLVGAFWQQESLAALAYCVPTQKTHRQTWGGKEKR